MNQLLQSYLANRIEPWYNKETAFFLSQCRLRISKRMVQTIAEKTLATLIEQYPQLLGKQLSAHKLRHLFVTDLMRNGADALFKNSLNMRISLLLKFILMLMIKLKNVQ